MIRRSFATLAVATFSRSPVIARADDPAAIPVPSTPAGVTHHAVNVAGTALHYTAIAGRTTLVDKAQKPAASVFSVAYLRDGIPHALRPVTFLWNGGPGSSTLWLHMGSFGPLRVETNGTDAIVPPGRLIPNDGTLLATTDLVFVDAPERGTAASSERRRRTISTASIRMRARSRNSSKRGFPRTTGGVRRSS